MEPALRELLGELEEFGSANDASTDDRSRRMLNITHDTGVFLALLVKATGSRNVLEIGTSNGYSTLWLADAVGADGSVTTVEKAPSKIALARQNFARAGLESRIRQVEGDAGDVIRSAGDAGYDFVFLDSDRDQYVGWWSDLRRIVAPGRLIVVDNAISHVHQLVDFTEAVGAAEGYLSSLSPIGNGELVILKEG
jgi:predicted O-methyltransferase YrrM